MANVPDLVVPALPDTWIVVLRADTTALRYRVVAYQGAHPMVVDPDTGRLIVVSADLVLDGGLRGVVAVRGETPQVLPWTSAR